MATPSKLHPERTRIICDAILAGAPVKVAARHGKIAESTHFAWAAKGLAALEQADDIEELEGDDRVYADYYEAVEHARREWELLQLALIQRAAQGQQWEETTTKTYEKDGVTFVETIVKKGVRFYWQAAAWLLERRKPQEYGRVFRAEITGPEGKPIELEMEEIAARGRAAVDELKRQRELREQRAVGQ